MIKVSFEHPVEGRTFDKRGGFDFRRSWRESCKAEQFCFAKVVIFDGEPKYLSS